MLNWIVRKRTVWSFNCVYQQNIFTNQMSKFQRQSLMIFIIEGFRTIVFIFIFISTIFRPICPPTFSRCLSNSGTFTELRTTSFIESAGSLVRMKNVVRSSVEVAEFDKHLKKAGGHIGRNVVEITIKMKAIVRKPLMIKIFTNHIFKNWIWH